MTLHVLLVLVGVSLEEVLERSQQTLERIPIDRVNFDFALRSDRGSSGLFLEQSEFSEVVVRLVLEDESLFAVCVTQKIPGPFL